MDSGSEIRPGTPLVLMAVLVSVWGLRLTYNFSRRGGYSIRFWTGEEDYRWAVLRAKPELTAKWRWMLFNFFFISLYQMGLILLITLPAVRSLERPSLRRDGLFARGIDSGNCVIETLADQQQWNYHKEKRKAMAAGGDIPEKYKKGFVHNGLVGPCASSQLCCRTSGMDSLLLFQCICHRELAKLVYYWSYSFGSCFSWGSSNFSESISAGKYPEYEEYKKKVPRFIPFT